MYRIWLLWATLLMACTSTPVIQTGSEAEKNIPGLVKVDGTLFDAVFVDPDANISSYAKFKFEPLNTATIEVKNPTLANNRESVWKFTEKDATQLADTYLKAGQRHFAGKHGLQLVNEAIPGVAVVKSRITRFAPSAPKMGAIDRSIRSQFFTRTSGDMTIVTDLYDAVSGKLIATLEHNNQIGDHVEMRENNSVQFQLDLRNSFSIWARNLAKQLSDLSDN